MEGPALTGYAHIETKLLAQLQYIVLSSNSQQPGRWGDSMFSLLLRWLGYWSEFEYLFQEIMHQYSFVYIKIISFLKTSSALLS